MDLSTLDLTCPHFLAHTRDAELARLKAQKAKAHRLNYALRRQMLKLQFEANRARQSGRLMRQKLDKARREQSALLDEINRLFVHVSTSCPPP